MRFVTAVTRGTGTNNRKKTGTGTGTNNRKKKTLGPRVAKCALDLQKIEMFSKKATEL